MKIVVTAGGIIWNECHPALQKYGSDVVTVRRTPDAEAELVARVGMDRDVLVLTDNDPRSFLPLQVLTRQFQSRRIHLFVCLPFSYESVRRKREILELLKDLSVVKTLCVVELDAFLNDSKKDETLGSLQLRIRNGMIGLIDRAVTAMDGLDEFSRYRFDFETGTYRPDDLSVLDGELAEKLLAKRKTASAAKPVTGNAAEEPAAEELAAEEPAAEELAAEESSPEETAPQETSPEETSPEETAPQETSPEETSPEESSPEESSPEESKSSEPKAEKKKRRSLFSFLRKRKD